MLNALFVIVGAGLWASDTLFRHPMLQQISPLTLVFLEHVFAVLITGVWVLAFQRKNLWLGWKGMAGAFFIGAFGSAIATLLFTASFQYINPSVTILLQKIQPFVVILLSSIFLGEKLTPRYWKWAIFAMLCAFFVSFPTGVHLDQFTQGGTIGVIFALAAAWFWALSTLSGKIVLKTAPSAALSFWRFFFGLVVLSGFVFLNTRAKIELPFVAQDPSILKSIFLMALIPGFLGVTLYYRGLAKVPASVATVLELIYPVTALWINAHYLDLHLQVVQYVAAFMLLIAMVGLTFAKK